MSCEYENARPEPKMAPTTTHDMQESEHPGEFFNGGRTKVDGRLLPESTDDLRQPADSKYDLRKSMAWDSAFFTSQGVLDSEELFQTLNFRDSENGVRKLPSDSLARERDSRINETNVRRSLAWDSSFFTGQGVLDPEELCLVNKGFRKFEANSLSCELWRSTESSTTIGSEYSLDSLEFELFDGMRASLLKSSNTSKDGHSGSRLKSRKLHSSRKSNFPNKRMNKSFPGSEKLNVQTLGEGRIRKQAGIPTESLHASQFRRINPPSSSKISTMPDATKTLAVAAGKKVFQSENKANPGKRIRQAASGQILANESCLSALCSEPQGLLKPPRSASHCCSPLKGSAGSYSASSSVSKSPQSSLRRKRDIGLAARDPNSTPPPNSPTSRRIKQLTSSQPITKSSSKSPLKYPPLDPLLNSPTPSKPSSRSRAVQSNSCLPQQVDLISEKKPSSLRKPSPKLGYFDVEIFTPPSLNRDMNMKFHAGAHSSSKTSGVNGLTGHKLPSPRPPTQKGNVKMTSPQTGVHCFRPALKPTCPPEAKVENDGKTSYPVSEVYRSCPENELSGKLNHGCSFKRASLQSNVGGEQVQEGDRIMKHKEKLKSSKEFLQNVKKPCHGQNEDAVPYGEDKENMCSIENQVDELSRSLGAMDFCRDWVIEF